MKKSSLTEKILIVAGKDDIPRLGQAYGVDCAEAGSTHNASVESSLQYVREHYPLCKKILFADAARPFITADDIDRHYRFLEEWDGVITARHITDSLGLEGERFTDRTPYYLIQKPESFRFELLNEHFSAESPATAIVQQMPRGANIMKDFDIRQNLKITYPEDLPLAEYLMGLCLKEGNK